VGVGEGREVGVVGGERGMATEGRGRCEEGGRGKGERKRRARGGGGVQGRGKERKRWGLQRRRRGGKLLPVLAKKGANRACLEPSSINWVSYLCEYSMRSGKGSFSHTLSTSYGDNMGDSVGDSVGGSVRECMSV
jgi:hypothetical protein